MATLTQIIKICFSSYFGVWGTGASDEPRFVSKTASVYTHLQSIKFRVKQDKRVRPVKGDKKGKFSAQECNSNGALLDFGSHQTQNQNTDLKRTAC